MYCSRITMTETSPPSLWARYWEATRCVAGSGPEFARLSAGGVESVARLLVGYERRANEAVRADARRLARKLATHVSVGRS
jgi:hypothetical protein